MPETINQARWRVKRCLCGADIGVGGHTQVSRRTSGGCSTLRGGKRANSWSTLWPGTSSVTGPVGPLPSGVGAKSHSSSSHHKDNKGKDQRRRPGRRPVEHCVPHGDGGSKERAHSPRTGQVCSCSRGRAPCWSYGCPHPQPTQPVLLRVWVRWRAGVVVVVGVVGDGCGSRR